MLTRHCCGRPEWVSAWLGPELSCAADASTVTVAVLQDWRVEVFVKNMSSDPGRAIEVKAVDI